MNEEIKILIDISSESNNNAYKTRKNHLKVLFSAYNTIKSGKLKNLLDGILEADRKYCISSQNDKLMREHNAFVMRYLSRKQPEYKEIAKYTCVCERQVITDCNRTLERLMIFAYGLDGIKWYEQLKI